MKKSSSFLSHAQPRSVRLSSSTLSSLPKGSPSKSCRRTHCHLSLKKGFTFIEIMITIIIIGILSLMGISMSMTTQKKGRDVKRKADLFTVVKALESYMNDYSTYPPSTDGKILWCGIDQEDACEWGEPLIKETTDVDTEGNPISTVYMTSLPKDTNSFQSYFYEFVEPNGYRLYARLENEKDPDWYQYATNCSTDATPRNCTYVITSEAVSNPI